jgi:Tfp pilus assembly protein PilF
MRGGLLSRLVSAFRLRQAVLSETLEVTEGTAKHGLNDHHDIGRARHVILLRAAVDQLFSAEYLVARGLDHAEATKHNDLVTQALDVVLTRWDQLAAVANVVPERPEPAHDLLALATGFSVELPLRLAAYEALYGYLHPFVSEIPSWLNGPRLKAWWSTMEGRARRPIKVSQLYADGELESHTVRDLRDGQALPKEGTVEVLAARLADHSIRDRHEDRDAKPSELEFELRVAVAVAEQKHIVDRLVAPRVGDGLTMQLQVLRHVLRSAPDPVAEDLLHHGTQAQSWALVEQLFRSTLMAHVIELGRAMRADADRKMADMDSEPTKVQQEMAEESAEQAAFLRSVDPRPGADGPEKRLAEHFENTRDLWLAMATDGQHPFPEPRPELEAELRADALCMKAIAPWPELSDDQQEKRLREAIRICDWSAYAHRSLAHHLQRVGKLDEAQLHLRRSVELNPNNEGGRESLALLLADRGDHEAVRTLTTRYETSPMLKAVRAYALVNLGDIPTAEALIDEVLNRYPRHPLALLVVAQCHRARGDEDKARELERRATFYERGVGPPGN